MGDRLAGLVERVRHQVLERDLSAAPWMERAPLLPLRIGVLAASNMGRHQLPIRAAALTYVSLFSVVPTLAVAFTIFRAFGGLEWAQNEIMPRLMLYLAAGSQAVVEAQIESFIDNIHGGAIGGLGVVLLLGSAIFLVAGVEDAFNRIWESPRSRSPIRRVMMYWTILTVPPLLLVGGLRLPGLLQRTAVVQWAIDHSPALTVLIALVLPLLLIWLGFTLLYVFVPNTRVSPLAAGFGAVVGGTLWWTAVRYAYAGVAAMGATYSKIYGSLSALPIFLFWLFVTWLIVLVGAEIAAAAQHVPLTPARTTNRPVSQATRELLAMRVMTAVARRFRDGAPPLLADELPAEVHAPAFLTAEAIQHLCDAELLAEVGESRRLLPQRDPTGLSPTDLLQALRHSGDDAIWDGDDPTTVALARWQAAADGAAARANPVASVLDLAPAGS
jgi:membrane protein